MLNCNDILTLVLNEKTEEGDYKTILFSGISWRHHYKSDLMDGMVKKKDVFDVRIPWDGASDGVLPFKKGQIMIKGNANVAGLKTFGKIREAFPDSFVIKNITPNFIGSIRTKHVHIESDM